MADPTESLPGWDLGIALPEREKRTVFLPGKARCRVCGKQISDQDWRLFQTCDFWKCRAKQRQERRESRIRREDEYRRRREVLAKRIGQFRDEVADSLGIDEPELFVPVAIPAALRPITRLPQERLSALRDHLTRLVSGVREEEEDSPCTSLCEETETAATDTEDVSVFFLQQACATCRGYCCLTGEDLAYLNKGMMSSYLDEHPRHESPEVISRFLSHLPEETCEDSCIYHGEKGCGLPREMRSSICNGFECAEIACLREELRGSAPHRVFLVGVRASRVVRYAFVQAGDVRRGVPPTAG